MTYHNIQNFSSTTKANTGATTKASGAKLITGIELDTSNIAQFGEERSFVISGDSGAVFSLQVRAGNNYYNFKTNLFQAIETKLLKQTIDPTGYTGSIKFPAVTVGEQYDVYLLTEDNTEHGEYREVRLSDNSIDVNASTGSSSNLVRKVIFQTLDVTLTINGYSPTGAITGTNTTTHSIVAPRRSNVPSIPFEFKFTSTALSSLSIIKPPTSSDVLALVERTVIKPIDIPGEDIYPTLNALTDVVNGDFSADNTDRIIMDNLVASKMTVGDRITTAATEATLAVTNLSLGIEYYTVLKTGTNAALIMSIGDRVIVATDNDGARTGKSDEVQYFDSNVVLVTGLDPNGDDATEFSVDIIGGREVGIAVRTNQGSKLEFNSRLDREVITVKTLNPVGNNTSQFDMSANAGIRDNSTLIFSNQRNHRWELDDVYGLEPRMAQAKATFFLSQPTIEEYLTQITVLEGEPGEYKIDDVRVPAIYDLGLAPVSIRHNTTKVQTITQKGEVTFDKQALLSFTGATTKILANGLRGFKLAAGYDIELDSLAVTLSAVTTTTTSAPSSSTAVNVTSADGIGDDISVVSGIGINPAVANPTVTAITNVGGATWDNSGQATLTLSTAQTLESGIALAFTGASRVATVTGNIKINKVGNEDLNVRFNLDKFLTMQ